MHGIVSGIIIVFIVLAIIFSIWFENHDSNDNNDK